MSTTTIDLTKEGERCGHCPSNESYLNCKVKGCAVLEKSVTEVNLYTKLNLPEGLLLIAKRMKFDFGDDYHSIIVVKTLSKYGSPDISYEFINSENSIQKVLECLRALADEVVGYDQDTAVKNKYNVLEAKNNHSTVRFHSDELTHKSSMKLNKGDKIIFNEKDFILLRNKTGKPFGHKKNDKE